MLEAFSSQVGSSRIVMDCGYEHLYCYYVYWNNCKHKHTQTSSISATAELNFRGLHIPVRGIVTAYPSIPHPPALVYPAGWTGSYNDHHDRNWANMRWNVPLLSIKHRVRHSWNIYLVTSLIQRREALKQTEANKVEYVLKGGCPCYHCEVIWPWFCLYQDFRLRIRRYSLNKKHDVPREWNIIVATATVKTFFISSSGSQF